MKKIIALLLALLLALAATAFAEGIEPHGAAPRTLPASFLSVTCH